MKLQGTKLITNNQSTASTGKRLISLFKTHVFALKFYAEKITFWILPFLK